MRTIFDIMDKGRGNKELKTLDHLAYDGAWEVCESENLPDTSEFILLKTDNRYAYFIILPKGLDDVYCVDVYRCKGYSV